MGELCEKTRWKQKSHGDHKEIEHGLENRLSGLPISSNILKYRTSKTKRRMKLMVQFQRLLVDTGHSLTPMGQIVLFQFHIKILALTVRERGVTKKKQKLTEKCCSFCVLLTYTITSTLGEPHSENISARGNTTSFGVAPFSPCWRRAPAHLGRLNQNLGEGNEDISNEWTKTFWGVVDDFLPQCSWCFLGRDDWVNFCGWFWWFCRKGVKPMHLGFHPRLFFNYSNSESLVSKETMMKSCVSFFQRERERERFFSMQSFCMLFKQQIWFHEWEPQKSRNFLQLGFRTCHPCLGSPHEEKPSR